jgi:hypothetical protein
VREAGTATDQGEVVHLVVWRSCSGIAHGDLWATLNVTAREEFTAALSPDLPTLKITADVKTLLVFLFSALAMTRRGWELYDQRAANHLG